MTEFPIRFPFEWIESKNQKRVFWELFLLALAGIIGEELLDVHLKTLASPTGIVSFEMAGSLSRVGEILNAWGALGQVYAGLSLGFDFLFIVAYSSFLAFACLLVARLFRGRSKTMILVGAVLAWGQFVAASFDILENISLIRLLLGSQSQSWPVLARWCATLKFSLVGLGIVFILAGALWALVARRRV